MMKSFLGLLLLLLPSLTSAGSLRSPASTENQRKLGECPSAEPTWGEDCDGNQGDKCHYGEQKCCNEVHPSKTCTCPEASSNTDPWGGGFFGFRRFLQFGTTWSCNSNDKCMGILMGESCPETSCPVEHPSLLGTDSAAGYEEGFQCHYGETVCCDGTTNPAHTCTAGGIFGSAFGFWTCSQTSCPECPPSPAP